MSWSHHREVAGLEPEQADALLEEAEKQEWSRQDLRREVHKLKSTFAAQQLPSSRYRVLYADPPRRWLIDFN